jgi:hypothetical protein
MSKIYKNLENNDINLDGSVSSERNSELKIINTTNYT